MGGITEGLVDAGHRAAARRARWAAIERAVRVPALVGLVVLALVAWWLSGWEMWPWVWGFGALVVLALLGIRARIGPMRAAGLALAVVDVGLLTYVDPWWWGVLVGVAVTGGGVAAAVRLRFRDRRAQTITALVVGPILVVASAVLLAVDAHEQEARDAAALWQQHEFAVARGLPRTPNEVAFMLVERIARRDVAAGCHLFAPAAQAQLAAAHRVPDCSAAFGQLAGLVTNTRDYLNNLWVPREAITQVSPDTNILDGCRLDWTSVWGDSPDPHPGPPLGVLTLQQQYGEGHLITEYKPCPAT